ncbi:hypothetical protein FGE12_13225 [Aggregicoccus sp. 17bor-14]|uniref:hypothetical protein n=1 Tax=Myxococcaceae TaxID=31 RepID=UPI00129CB225|nr:MULTISPECIES: hypothetical protein [Myxococcaceae]MBF5043353.1 hypothetical protein [Simulacricoccus sp. 17bor-14]MRI89112.1 hypothetical protein [Aggregicoccus sp. 17bor-14]
MLSSLLVVSLLAAAPAKQPNLASPGLAAAGVPPDVAAGITDHLDRQLARQGVKVQSAASMQHTLPEERWRKLFECDWHSKSCLAQYGEALGVSGVLTGEVSRGEAGYAARIQVLSVKDGTALADEFVTGFGLPELQQAIVRLAPRLADQLALRLETRLDRPTSSRVWALAPLGVGIGLSAGGTLLLINATQKRDFIEAGFPDGPATPLDAFKIRDAGHKQQLWGGILVGAGLTAIVGSVVLYKVQESNTPKNLLSGVSVGPSGIVVSGVLP